MLGMVPLTELNGFGFRAAPKRFLRVRVRHH